MLVNVGDLLARWSNGRWKSSVHRVVAPWELLEGGKETGESGEDVIVPDRYSIPFFATADMETVIEALPSCVDDEHPRMFESVTAWEYVQMRMRALYEG